MGDRMGAKERERERGGGERERLNVCERNYDGK